MSSPVVLVLGAGSRVGTGVARHFKEAGYAVALVSRSNPSPPAVDPETSHLRIRADVSVPSDVRGAFDAVRGHFGTAPRVVVYNAATLTPPAPEGALFGIADEAFARDLGVNVTGAWVAAGEAVKGWERDGEGKGRFVFTGNVLNEKPVPVPLFVTLGVGKSASWYWVGTADGVYKEKGWRFFYADERKADGGSVGNDVGADSHGKFYLELAEGNVDALPSAVTFVDGEYRKF
ncbi:hypothetical protein C8034_v000316 [Colletotrichum sidae]|uniref:Uncharacterized protein n=1 Tax=Colletotrichum sidae TaxID=1347389 RepID=A0A4R8TGB2_9PEZI|nr:hypothetical protein C8034_v000316 [Colletotrichum sidae]